MPDNPASWDSLGPAFHAAVQTAEGHGRMTYTELDAVIPDGDYTSKQIEILLDYLGRRGITLVEADCDGPIRLA